MLNRREKGKLSEQAALEFLQRHGVQILCRNFRCPIGEIDLIGRDGKTIVFIEVKSRFGTGYGLPQELVSDFKQKRLTRLAEWYLKSHRLENQPARFDVVAVTWVADKPELTWIPNAFEAIR